MAATRNHAKLQPHGVADAVAVAGCVMERTPTFGVGSDAIEVQREGWSPPEEGCTWTPGHRAT